MTHWVVAGSFDGDTPAAALAQALQDAGFQVSRLDLDPDPGMSRARAAIGFGWMARERVRRVAESAGVEVDAVVEVADSGRRHLLGLGRIGIPAYRWVPRNAETPWLDRLAVKEGAVAIVADDADAAARACQATGL